MTLKEYLKQIADAIREKKKSTATIPAELFPEEILALSGGGNAEIGNEYDLILNGYYSVMPSYQCDQILNGAYIVEY